MTPGTSTPDYSHKRAAPLCLILNGIGITAITLAVMMGNPVGIVNAGSVSLALLLFAPCFHNLTVEGQGEVLAIWFGPVPLFRRTAQYADIDFPRGTLFVTIRAGPARLSSISAC